MRVQVDYKTFYKGDEFYAKIGIGDVRYHGSNGFTFRVLNKKKFFISVLKYNISYREVDF